MSIRRLAAMAALCAALMTPGALAADAGDYRIEVDVANQITTVYRTADGSVARQMLCSTGKNDSTPRGSFQLEDSHDRDRREWYYIKFYDCYVRYPTRIQGSILFHSLPYIHAEEDCLDTAAEELLGTKASHGCVRLRLEDARWIAENCPDGTETRIFTGTARQEALREKLREGGYSDEDGMSYEDFIRPIAGGISTLSLGDSGAAVENLQRRLHGRGWYTGEITGEYDEATLIAVSQCQRALGMSPTGIATEALMRRLTMEE